MKSRIGFYLIFILSSVFTPLCADVNETVLWQVFDQSSPAISSNENALAKKTVSSAYHNALLLKLNQQQMRERLESVAISGALKSKSAKALKIITIPLLLPSGQEVMVKVTSDEVLPAGQIEKFPGNSTFKILPGNVIFAGRLGLTQNGFHAILNTVDGETIFIDPVDVASSLYASYRKSDQQEGSFRQFSCSVSDQDSVLNKFMHIETTPVKSAKY